MPRDDEGDSERRAPEAPLPRGPEDLPVYQAQLATWCSAAHVAGLV